MTIMESEKCPNKLKCLKSTEEYEENSSELLALVSRTKPMIEELINISTSKSKTTLNTANTECRSNEIKQKTYFKCEACGKQFKTTFWLNKHQIKHLSKHTCDLCGKLFKRNSTLIAHCREIHKEEKSYCCNQCLYATNNKTNFQIHIRTQHGNVNEVGIKCDSCEKKFFRKEDMIRHQIKVHNAPRFKCSICNNSYTSMKYLNVHKKIHGLGFKPEHQCSQCGKLFPTGGRLSSHVRQKHCPQDYRCTECDKQLCSAKTLRDHMTQHTGARPHSCVVCDRQFATHKYLQVHARTHTGEKPYSCEQCNKAFTQRSSFTVHLRRFHS